MHLYKLNQLVDGAEHDEDAILLTHRSPFSDDEFERMFDRIVVQAMEQAANKNPSILPNCYASHWMPEAAKLMCETFGFEELRVQASTAFHSGRLDMGHDSGVYDERTAAVVKRAEEHGPLEHPKVVAERETRKRIAMLQGAPNTPDTRKAIANTIDQLLVEQVLRDDAAGRALDPFRPMAKLSAKDIIKPAKGRQIIMPLNYRGPAITGVVL